MNSKNTDELQTLNKYWYNEETFYLRSRVLENIITNLSAGYFQFNVNMVKSRRGMSLMFFRQSIFQKPFSSFRIQFMDSKYRIHYSYYENGYTFDEPSQNPFMMYEVDTPPGPHTVRFNIGSGKTDINGVEQECVPLDSVQYVYDGPFIIAPGPKFFTLFSSFVGWMWDFQISNGTELLVHYDNDSDSMYEWVDKINGLNFPKTEILMPPGEERRFGYDEYSTHINRIKPKIYINNNPFDDVDFDFTQEPTDIKRAYLLYKDTGEPFIPEWPESWSYPYFSREPIDNLIRNPDCWYFKKSMTCFSVQSQWHGFAGHQILLSPRHVLMANHIFNDFTHPFRKAWFMDMDNNYQEAKGYDAMFVKPEYGLKSDTVILLLENEITLDVDYATFMTDYDFENYDCRWSPAAGPTKEGYFAHEELRQLRFSGCPGPNYKESEVFPWSRYNNIRDDKGRVGDSSSPIFALHDDILFFISITTHSLTWPFNSGGTGICNYVPHTWNHPDNKAAIQAVMDELDIRNGLIPKYKIQTKPIAKFIIDDEW